MKLYVVPAPPVLHPIAASGAAGELDQLRAAISELVNSASQYQNLFILCAGATTNLVTHTVGDLRTFGIKAASGELPREFTVSTDCTEWLSPAARMPYAMVVFYQLLSARSWSDGPTRTLTAVQVSSDGDSNLLLQLQRLLQESQDCAIVVLGELSARRGGSRFASLSVSPDAEAFDAAFRRSFEEGDVMRLRTLLSREGGNMVASLSAPLGIALSAFEPLTHWQGETRYMNAPYGVTYFAGVLTPTETPQTKPISMFKNL